MLTKEFLVDCTNMLLFFSATDPMVVPQIHFSVPLRHKGIERIADNEDCSAGGRQTEVVNDFQ